MYVWGGGSASCAKGEGQRGSWAARARECLHPCPTVSKYRPVSASPRLRQTPPLLTRLRTRPQQPTTLKNTTPAKLSKKLLTLLRQAITSRDPKSSHLADYNAQRIGLPVEDRVAHFRKALELVPNAPFIIDQLGIALSMAGRRRTAALLYENAVARGIWANVDQRPLSKHVAGLDTKAWHDEATFAFTSLLASHYPVILREYTEGVSSVDRPLPTQNEGIHSGGTWHEFVLRKHNVEPPDATTLFPLTLGLLRDISNGAGAFAGSEGVDIFNAKFSVLSPGTHVRPHCGPTNARLRAHLAVHHTGGAFLRVRDETRSWQEGQGACRYGLDGVQRARTPTTPPPPALTCDSNRIAGD